MAVTFDEVTVEVQPPNNGGSAVPLPAAAARRMDLEEVSRHLARQAERLARLEAD